MLNIYINTWRNYNENGADNGKWISLPMDVSGLEIELETVAENMKDNDPEWFINDYEWTADHIRDINENENIFDLNEEIEKLDNLDLWEQEIFSAAVEVFGYDHVDLDNLDEFTFINNINDDYDLGYYWIEESGCYDLKSMGNLKNYIDYEAFGRDVRFESNGGFCSMGWIERH